MLDQFVVSTGGVGGVHSSGSAVAGKVLKLVINEHDIVIRWPPEDLRLGRGDLRGAGLGADRGCMFCCKF